MLSDIDTVVVFIVGHRKRTCSYIVWYHQILFSVLIFVLSRFFMLINFLVISIPFVPTTAGSRRLSDTSYFESDGGNNGALQSARRGHVSFPVLFWSLFLPPSSSSPCSFPCKASPVSRFLPCPWLVTPVCRCPGVLTVLPWRGTQVQTGAMKSRNTRLALYCYRF